MYKVLITSRSFGKNSNLAAKYLEDNDCELHYAPKGQLKSQELASIVKGYDALIIGIDEVSREVIEASDNLKVICMHGTGIDHIDVQAASEYGIYVANAPGANRNAVAELTIGLMIAAARNLYLVDNSVRKQTWVREIGFELSGKTIGIVGLGHIGKRVIELLSGFNANILVFSKRIDEEYALKTGVKFVEFDELVKNSDVISLHVPLNKETVGMIQEEQLNMMKRNAILINTSRGGLIDEKALYKALKEKRIAAAALDVFVNEPLESTSLLRELDNIILTPHVGASTFDTADHVDLINAQSTVSVLKKQELYCIVNEMEVNKQKLKIS